ncbi:MAG: DNA-processing protein DprA [Bdellovibrionales bacterium]|nr:DNA-processing protein DprA [Bdellovibrionales bacterium]
MVWADYLALLTWQGCKVFLKDFESLTTFNPHTIEDIKSIVSHSETKQFLIHNKYWWKKAEENYKSFSQKGYKLTWPGKEDYPSSFLKLNSPPLSLTYLGDLLRLEKEQYFPLTIVGSRKGQETALNWMDFYLPKIIRTKKICLVSGGARGIDQKVHSIAIRLSSPTVCFLPSGLDFFYPSGLLQFKKSILDHGGVFISCFPPEFEMRKPFFHIRNELLACYSRLVLVGQAQIRSGTMLTAQKALNYGVPVAALPGPPLSAAWTGNLQLLYDGAYLLRDETDLSLLIESLIYNPNQSCLRSPPSVYSI